MWLIMFTILGEYSVNNLSGWHSPEMTRRCCNYSLLFVDVFKVVKSVNKIKITVFNY